VVAQTPPPVPPPPPPAPKVEAAAPDAEDSIEIPDDTEPAARVGLPENAVDLDPALAVDTILSLARKSAAVRRTPTAGAWFAELFGNDYFLAHPQRLGPATTREVEFIEAALRIPNGGRILDLCCGYGRHTVPLAAKGYELVGLDLSLDMLKAALGRAQANSLAIKFVHGDMRDLNFREVFDGVYSFDSSFGFFTEPENLMVLRGVHDALKRGGRFVLDVANRDSAIRGIPTRNWWEGDGCLVQEDIEFDYMTSRLVIKRFAVFADGMQREYNISMRLYAVHELVRMLQMVGFEVRELSGNRHTTGAFFGPESNRIILVAEKPASRP
jgi:SAM-dependent methyltransferase